MAAATPPERSSSVATARPYSKLSLLSNLEEEFETTTFMNENRNAFPPTPPQDDDVITVSPLTARRLSQTPTEERNQAPGIPDRRRSTRPSTGRSGSGSSVKSPGSLKGRRIPVKVNGVRVSSPLASPMSLSGMRNEMRLTDDDLTPGESSVCLPV